MRKRRVADVAHRQRVLKFIWLPAPICPGPAPLLLCPGLSTSHVVHTAKWSLTNLFHYRNDLHDWTPRELVQDCFHSTAINSLPMSPVRSDQQGKRLQQQCSWALITEPVLEQRIQLIWFSFNWNWVLHGPAPPVKLWHSINSLKGGSILFFLLFFFNNWGFYICTVCFQFCSICIQSAYFLISKCHFLNALLKMFHVMWHISIWWHYHI